MNEGTIPIFYNTKQGVYVIKIMPTMLKIVQEIMIEGAKKRKVKLKFEYIPEEI
jgi:hypothetical protein